MYVVVLLLLLRSSIVLLLLLLVIIATTILPIVTIIIVNVIFSGECPVKFSPGDDGDWMDKVVILEASTLW